MLIGGSSRDAGERGRGQEAQDASGDDGGDREMAYGKGSSIIVGRKVTDSWEPGEPVEGPPVITSTRRIYSPWPPDSTRSLGRRAPRVLRISYGCVKYLIKESIYFVVFFCPRAVCHSH